MAVMMMIVVMTMVVVMTMMPAIGGWGRMVVGDWWQGGGYNGDPPMEEVDMLANSPEVAGGGVGKKNILELENLKTVRSKYESLINKEKTESTDEREKLLEQIKSIQQSLNESEHHVVLERSKVAKERELYVKEILELKKKVTDLQKLLVDKSGKEKNGVELEFEGETPRTPQQNGVIERKNMTLVEAARMILNASGLPLTFWTEAVSAACFTQNRSLVVKRFEKTRYQLLHNKRPNIKFFLVFGCKCYVLNDREPIGKFDPKGDDAIFIGYAWDSLAYRVYVTHDKFTEELKIQAEKSPNATIPQDLESFFNEWYDDEPDPDRASDDVPRASVKEHYVTDTSPQSTVISRPSAFDTPPSTSTPQEWTKDHPQSQIIGDPSDGVKTREVVIEEVVIEEVVIQAKSSSLSIFDPTESHSWSLPQRNIDLQDDLLSRELVLRKKKKRM
ncbi:hypothetical protein OSB04_019641 [Centaurea solstitialis]|uniref:Retroviral polymerase SH3-like domain-containing protein n=1 Tax=Centaurea solstitialis TaxID=347529 RepID=A0AA38SYD4_9ASTR|nr:hypothetical protein OSB04_019641 [Centaurea solstitialis]